MNSNMSAELLFAVESHYFFILLGREGCVLTGFVVLRELKGGFLTSGKAALKKSSLKYP